MNSPVIMVEGNPLRLGVIPRVCGRVGVCVISVGDTSNSQCGSCRCLFLIFPLLHWPDVVFHNFHTLNKMYSL